jgi:hypothetical protein
MKVLTFLLVLTFASIVNASVPTEEGLLKNLNNAGIPGNLITIKSMITSNAVGPGSDLAKSDYYKFIISLENPNAISLLQVAYSNGQMLNSQIRDVKYIPNMMDAIKKEKTPEKGMFYSLFLMLATNRSEGAVLFLEKSGIQVIRNKNILNEEKMKLLRSYKSYLATTKGKGDATSPLNPTDPQNKAKIVELFRSNTFQRARNIELVKRENEFVWKVDWKNITGYFSNEERRFRLMEYSTGENVIKAEASEYVLFNGTNELPKYITIKDAKGEISKIQILSLDTKINTDKKLSERYEESKKSIVSSANLINYSFLY